ncbi:MAG: porin family protein [Flavobacterium sp.]|nr:porin family protein [Flavobacterium sp.]
MKKVLLSAVAIFAFAFANAQEVETTDNGGFAKGNVFVSGAVSFSSEKDVQNTFVIAPKAGYFVSDNIAVGLQVGYTTTKYDTPDATDNTFSVGAFGRYYFTPASKFSLFGDLGFTYDNYDRESLAGFGYNGKGDGFTVAIKPGINYFLSNHFSLEASVAALSYETTKPDGGSSSDRFFVGGDWTNVSFGVIYKF